MKKFISLFACLAFFAVQILHADTVRYYSSHFTGTTNNRAVTFSMQSDYLAIGTNVVFGVPRTIQPIGGFFQTNLLPGNYWMKIDQVPTPIPIGITGFTNTVNLIDTVNHGLLLLVAMDTNAIWSLVTNVAPGVIAQLGSNYISATNGMAVNGLTIGHFTGPSTFSPDNSFTSGGAHFYRGIVADALAPLSGTNLAGVDVNGNFVGIDFSSVGGSQTNISFAAVTNVPGNSLAWSNAAVVLAGVTNEALLAAQNATNLLALSISNAFGIGQVGLWHNGSLSSQASLSAAKASAVAGDVVIVSGGSYTNADLLKPGVNWVLRSALVVFTNTGPDSVFGIFDDRNSGATTNIIDAGTSTIWYQNFTNLNVLGSIVVTNTNTVLSAHLGEIRFSSWGAILGNANVDFQYAGVHIENCKFADITADRCWDPMRTNINAGHARNASGVVWFNGQAHVSIAQVDDFGGGGGNGYSVWAVQNGPATSSNDLYFAANVLKGHAYVNAGTQSVWRTWWNVGEFQAGLSLYDGGKHYVNFEKMAHGPFSAALELGSGNNGEYWVTGQKLQTSEVTGSAIRGLVSTPGSSLAHVTVQHYDDAATSHSTSQALVENVGSVNLFIHGGTLTPMNRPAFRLNNTGTNVTFLESVVIQAARTNLSDNYPIVLDTGVNGLTMKNCFVQSCPAVALGVVNEEGSDVVTMTNIGSIFLNAAIDSTVLMVGNPTLGIGSGYAASGTATFSAGKATVSTVYANKTNAIILTCLSTNISDSATVSNIVADTSFQAIANNAGSTNRFFWMIAKP